MTTAAFFLLKHAAQNREHWLQRFYEIEKEAVRPRKTGEVFAYIVSPSRNQARLETIMQRAQVTFYRARGFRLDGVTYPDQTDIIPVAQPYGSFAEAVLEPQRYPDLRDQSGRPIPPYDVTAHTLPLLMGFEAHKTFAPVEYPRIFPFQQPTVPSVFVMATAGIYKSHVAAIDEGWTKFVLPEASIWATELDDNQIRNRAFQSPVSRHQLRSMVDQTFDAIIIPDQPRAAILNGHRAGTMPPEYTGGLGAEGVKALREFVEQGGTLVCLNRASDFAIEQFKLPIRDVVDGLPRTDFYVPGSILRIELDTSDPIAKGMPKESIAWVENSPVFELVRTGSGSDRVDPSNVHVIAWYPKDKDPLLSGWLLGGDRIKGKAALVEVGMGKGRIILFGFRPQYRGQSLATYPLFFNAITGK